MKVVPLDKWVDTTKKLLLQERNEEIEGVQHELATLPDAENPNVLVNLRLTSFSTALFGRTLVKLAFPSQHVQRPKPHAFTVGDLVQIRIKTSPTTTASSSSTGSSTAFPTGIVARVEETAISIALGEGDDVEEDQLLSQNGGITIDRLVNNATFVKISSALDRLAKCDAGHAQNVVDVVFSGKTPSWHTPLPAITPFNSGLNDSQLESIRFALASKDLALIHGPPGTGKTTTVVEFIRQAVKTYGMKVLVCAPSNIAVDNVLEKMAAISDPTLKLTRVGHPARLLPQILKYCLDARIESSEGTGIVNDIRKEMHQMESQLKKTRDKTVRFQLRRGLKANRKEIRQREQKVVVELLQHSDVVFATTVGAASKLLKDTSFDLVVIDEAAQALEAACWIPMLKAKRCVLAGDHLQLPPTIKSKAAAKNGLGTTLFDRVTQMEHTREIVKMLKIQYRMHQDISDWSSRAMYHGELTSFDGVATRKMHQLPHVQIQEDDELLNATLLLIDTAGCDLEEDTMEEEDGKNGMLKLSKSNQGEARVVARHVRALLKTGLRTDELAVITPYNKQVQLLKSLLLDEFPTLEIRSVDGFQGCEKEAVVMSLVRSNAAHEVGFLADERRMNVAVTRAKRHVALVCDTETIRANKFLTKMVDHFEELGEYRSAHEFLEDDVVHGHAVGVVVAHGAAARATEPKPPTRGRSAPKAAVDATVPRKALVADTPNKSASANPPAKAIVELTTDTTSTAVDDDNESESESEKEQEKHATHQQPKTSVFQHHDLLHGSDSSSDSEKEETEEVGTLDPLASANALLRELHLNRLTRQPPPPPSATSKKHKNKKNKKNKKSQANPAAGRTGSGQVVAVATRQHDEDDLAFLSRQADQSHRCCFQKATTCCKKAVTLMGAVCKFCKLKFCYDHAQPEVHGCGDAVRQFERQHFHATATRATPAKLSADKRKLLQKKLGDKVTEQSATRTAKATRPKK